MMKGRLTAYLLLFFLLSSAVVAQENPYWSIPDEQDIPMLKNTFRNSSNDTIKMYISRKLGFFYEEVNYDSSISYFQNTLKYAEALNQELWQAEALAHIGFSYSPLGDFPNALYSLLKARSLIEGHTNKSTAFGLSELTADGDYETVKKTLLGIINVYIGIMYTIMGDQKESIEHWNNSLAYAKELNDPLLISWNHMNYGEYYNLIQKPDSALYHNRIALSWWRDGTYNRYKGFILNEIADAFALKNEYDSAKYYYYLSIVECQKAGYEANLAWAYVDFANMLLSINEFDSAYHYSTLGIRLFEKINIPNALVYAYQTQVAYFDNQNLDSAFFYLNKAMHAKDQLMDIEKQSMVRSLNVESVLRFEKLEQEKLMAANRNRIAIASSIIVGIVIISLVLLRSNRLKEKAKKKVERTLEQLKVTQSQLIQSEKMASLGELTAGIAHEIQNPLNFVNNFSEVNRELIEELKDAVASNDQEEIHEILKDLAENEEKVKHHGKRAEGIVKGMLQHSRTSPGEKEPTDINALADEYLRLAYHGLRAKDKNFNADFKTDFDESLPKVNIVPQDIGRVLLNLINNAFYAVDKKAKSGINGYKPEVIASTKKHDSSIEISVKDNGEGIPKQVRDKIFQPFFTTKPTGSGTGLGLSLSYDIVKAHGGDLKLESKEGEGSVFIIQLPNIKIQ